ncbi:MAG: tyrosine-type recombinase/integrase [Bacteroidales bacterium]|jgi:integrase|nr:tyrosine-type recombinase/integrase [Bacteroidales bacterium]
MAKKGLLTTADWLDYDEYKRLLDCLRRDKEYLWETYARLGFCTGCRISDVLGLRWCDVLGSEHSIKEKKTGKTRKVTFNESVRNKLTELYELMGSPNPERLVFASNCHGKRDKYHFVPYSVQYINKKFKEFKKAYGLDIKNFSSHTFRKTFGRYVYETTGRDEQSLILLNKIFKHSSIAITKTYIGITDDEVKAVFDSIEF